MPKSIIRWIIILLIIFDQILALDLSTEKIGVYFAKSLWQNYSADKFCCHYICVCAWMHINKQNFLKKVSPDSILLKIPWLPHMWNLIANVLEVIIRE